MAITCLLCGEAITGPVVVRLRQGGIRYRHAFTEYIPDEFEDGATVKWLHNTCAARNDIFPNRLSRERCSLCNHYFDPMESLLWIERGVLDASAFSKRQVFDSQQGGWVHYMCAVDQYHLNVLLNLIADAI